MAFGTFAETQWKTLVFPTLKLSTQHGYKSVLRNAPAALLAGLAAARHRPHGRSSNGSRRSSGSVRAGRRCAILGAALRHSRNGGRVRISLDESGAGREVPAEGTEREPAIIAGGDFAKLLAHVDEPYRTMVSLIAATGLRIGELLALALAGAGSRRRHACRARVSVRGQVPAAEDAEGAADDSARAAMRSPRSTRIELRVTRTAPEDLVFGNRKGGPLREVQAAAECAAAGGGSGRARTGDVASVPPHPLVAAERSEGAGEDRAGAARAREHFDDAQHLHARRRCVAPQGD